MSAMNVGSDLTLLSEAGCRESATTEGGLAYPRATPCFGGAGGRFV